MSFDSLLRHTVTIRRAMLGSEDEYGQPSRTVVDVATVRALIQPISARSRGEPEELTTYSGGTQITDHTIFLRVTDVTAADEVYAVSAGAYTGKTFLVVLVKDAGGQSHHIELDTRLIEAAAVPEGS